MGTKPGEDARLRDRDPVQQNIEERPQDHGSMASDRHEHSPAAEGVDGDTYATSAGFGVDMLKDL